MERSRAKQKFDEAELCSDFLILDRNFKQTTYLQQTQHLLFIVRSFIQKVSVLIEEKFKVYQN